MFGLYRLGLATLVAVQHLLSIPVVGDHAVHGFFVLSGYLMTRVLCDVYGFSAGGVRAFAVNRALRLYPIYWMILVFSVVVILVFGEQAAQQYRSFLYLPDNPASVLQNLSLIYPAWYPDQIEPRLSPPTWSLTVEVAFYALMALGAARSRFATLLWLALSASVVAAAVVWEMPARFYYSGIVAQSLPFAMGAMLYHCGDQLTALYVRLPWLAGPLVLAPVLVLHSLGASALVIMGLDRVEVPAVFGNMMLQLLLTASLSRIGPATAKWRGWQLPDRFPGDLAYPVFLLHWQVGFALSMAILGRPVRGPSLDGAMLLVLTLVVSVLLGALLLWLDKPVQRLRGRVRPRQVPVTLAHPDAPRA